MKQYLSLSYLCSVLLLAYYSPTGAQIHIVKPASIKASISSDMCIQKDSNLLRSQLAQEAEQIFSSSILPQLHGLYTDIFQQARVQTFIKAIHLATTG